MIEPRYGRKPENEILRKKKGGGTPFSQHKKRSTLDFLNFLYNQVRWSSLRGSKRLKKIIYERNQKKQMSLQDQKKYHYAKLKFCLLERFRSAETLGPALTSSNTKPYIPDNSKPSSPGKNCKTAPKHLFFIFFRKKKFDFSSFFEAL